MAVVINSENFESIVMKADKTVPLFQAPSVPNPKERYLKW